VSRTPASFSQPLHITLSTNSRQSGPSFCGLTTRRKRKHELMFRKVINSWLTGWL